MASAAIGLFYGAGLMWGRQTHLAMAEYWRWWVVHLWVEGFFEVFATVVIAFLFTRMGLLRIGSATTAVIFSTVIFLAGGIIGTMHHLYFTGTPTAVLALGATFSALEIVPLVLIGFEGYENLTLEPGAALGVGLPLADPVLRGGGVLEPGRRGPVRLPHQPAHRALLHAGPEHHAGARPRRAVRRLRHAGHRADALLPARPHAARANGRPRALAFSFWSINVGLALMVLLSLLPVGLLQTWASVEHGMWYARSAEFLQTPLMDKLRWLRVAGRHHLRPRRARPGLVRAGPQDRLVLRQQRGSPGRSGFKARHGLSRAFGPRRNIAANVPARSSFRPVTITLAGLERPRYPAELI